MADVKSTVNALGLAQDAVKQVYGVYDMALELQTLLDAFDDSNDPPKWVFPLSCMVIRIASAADHAHMAALRVRMGLESLAGVPESFPVFAGVTNADTE